jgi:hypothetical protein
MIAIGWMMRREGLSRDLINKLSIAGMRQMGGDAEQRVER